MGGHPGIASQGGVAVGADCDLGAAIAAEGTKNSKFLKGMVAAGLDFLPVAHETRMEVFFGSGLRF